RQQPGLRSDRFAVRISAQPRYRSSAGNHRHADSKAYVRPKDWGLWPEDAQRRRHNANECFLQPSVRLAHNPFATVAISFAAAANERRIIVGLALESRSGTKRADARRRGYSGKAGNDRAGRWL